MFESSFIWLKDAGVALPTYCASKPAVSLLLSKTTNLFKLFASDVGLAAMYADGIQMKILMNEMNMNYDAIYENVVAQELKCHGFDLYYYNNNRTGELDFLVEYKGKENIRYYPIYMIGFVQKEEPMEDLIYKPDLSVLR